MSQRVGNIYKLEIACLTLAEKVTNKLSTSVSLKMAERSEAKSAKYLKF